MRTNLFGETIPTSPTEILNNAPDQPCAPDAVLLAFSGGNDSRTLAHVVKPWFEASPYRLELAAIDTGLSMDGWRDSVCEFAEWIGLPVSFWAGEGRDYYTGYVEQFGFPGNALHRQIQTRLKGRAFDKMIRGRNGGTVWILSGIRKYESRRRQQLASPYSKRQNALFINPIFYWTNEQVIDYMIDHSVPFAPGKQWDCKCGATVRDAKAEWTEIETKAPCLRKYIESLSNPMPWDWASFDATAHAMTKQLLAGQMFMDDGSLESFPVCVNCVKDLVE